MSYVPNTQYVVQGVLAAAVVDTGTFTVAYPTGTTQLTFTNGLANTAGCKLILGGSSVLAYTDDFTLTFGSSEITVTNAFGATWAAGTTFVLGLDVRDGNDVVFLTLPLPALSAITAADVVTEILPGIEGTLESVQFVTTTAVTTGSKAADLNLEIDTTNVTGGVVALTSAAATPIGKVIAGSEITANNTLTKTSKLSVEAANVTAFSEGAGYLVVRIRRTNNYL